MFLFKLTDEVYVDAAERAKLERKYVARRQLHLWFLLRAIWERRTGGQPRGASARCTSVHGIFAAVRTSCVPPGCAPVPRGPRLPRYLLRFLWVILHFLACP